MTNPECSGLPNRPVRLCLIVIGLIAGTVSACGQAPASSPYYARTNTYSFFSAYSDDSSHILMGAAENRKLLEFGAGYGRKLFVNRIVNWQYNAEILPVALESDPVIVNTINWTSPTVYTESKRLVQTTPCVPSSGSYSSTQNGTTYSYNYTFSCSRQWTMGESLSPIGFQWNFMPRRRMQPFFINHGGYIYSKHPIPVPDAGSFNFTFDFGVGVEVYRTMYKSIRAEYRFHHISDANSTNPNPGIDNGLFQITYSFGR